MSYTLPLCDTCLMYVCDMTHSHALYNMYAARILLTRLMYMCDMSQLYVWRNAYICLIRFVIQTYMYIHATWIQVVARQHMSALTVLSTNGAKMSCTTLSTTTLPSAAILAMYIDTREWLIDFCSERIQRWTDVFDACNECITNSMFDVAFICPKTFLTPHTRRLRVLLSGRERMSVCVCVQVCARRR